MKFETDRQNIKTDQGIIFQTPSPHSKSRFWQFWLILDPILILHFSFWIIRAKNALIWMKFETDRQNIKTDQGIIFQTPSPQSKSRFWQFWLILDPILILHFSFWIIRAKNALIWMKFETDRQNIKTDQGIILQTPSPHSKSRFWQFWLILDPILILHFSFWIIRAKNALIWMKFETDRQNIKTDQGIIFQTPSPQSKSRFWQFWLILDPILILHFSFWIIRAKNALIWMKFETDWQNIKTDQGIILQTPSPHSKSRFWQFWLILDPILILHFSFWIIRAKNALIWMKFETDRQNIKTDQGIILQTPSPHSKSRFWQFWLILDPILILHFSFWIIRAKNALIWMKFETDRQNIKTDQGIILQTPSPHSKSRFWQFWLILDPILILHFSFWIIRAKNALIWMKFETDRQNIKTDQGIIFQTPSPHSKSRFCQFWLILDPILILHFSFWIIRAKNALIWMKFETDRQNIKTDQGIIFQTPSPQSKSRFWQFWLILDPILILHFSFWIIRAKNALIWMKFETDWQNIKQIRGLYYKHLPHIQNPDSGSFGSFWTQS